MARLECRNPITENLIFLSLRYQLQGPLLRMQYGRIIITTRAVVWLLLCEGQQLPVRGCSPLWKEKYPPIWDHIPSAFEPRKPDNKYQPLARTAALQADTTSASPPQRADHSSHCLSEDILPPAISPPSALGG